MTLGEIVAEILHTMGEIERMLNQDVPEDEIDALAARLPALFEERARRMHLSARVFDSSTGACAPQVIHRLRPGRFQRPSTRRPCTKRFICPCNCIETF